MKKIGFVLLLGILSCSKESEENKVVVDYINEVTSLMEQRSLNRANVNWNNLKAEVLTRAASAKSIREAEPALVYLLTELKDNHSHIITPDGRYLFGVSAGCPPRSFTGVSDSEVGYIRIAFTTSTGAEAVRYAENLQASIRNQDNTNLKGWVIDLRSTGGNKWPMIAGLGPLLGEGIAGYSIEPDNNFTTWAYTAGSAVDNQTNVVTVPNPYSVLKPANKIAILIDPGTASAAEAIAVSFIGKPNTRLFGNPTCGLSTFIQSYPLSNNSILELTVGVLADRNKKTYGGKINPDEVTSDPGPPAIRWIKE